MSSHNVKIMPRHTVMVGCVVLAILQVPVDVEVALPLTTLAVPGAVLKEVHSHLAVVPSLNLIVADDDNLFVHKACDS